MRVRVFLLPVFYASKSKVTACQLSQRSTLLAQVAHSIRAKNSTYIIYRKFLAKGPSGARVRRGHYSTGLL